MSALAETLAAAQQRLEAVLLDGAAVPATLAHELRGLARNVGAERLADVVGRFESSLAAGDELLSAALVPDLLRESQHCIDFIAGRTLRQKV